MHLTPNANSLEFVAQSYWLVRARIRDWAGDEATMRRIRDTLWALSCNEWSLDIARYAYTELQRMGERRGAVG